MAADHSAGRAQAGNCSLQREGSESAREEDKPSEEVETTRSLGGRPADTWETEADHARKTGVRIRRSEWAREAPGQSMTSVDTGKEAGTWTRSTKQCLALLVDAVLGHGKQARSSGIQQMKRVGDLDQQYRLVVWRDEEGNSRPVGMGSHSLH